jgi:thioredoxin reductase
MRTSVAGVYAVGDVTGGMIWPTGPFSRPRPGVQSVRRRHRTLPG